VSIQTTRFRRSRFVFGALISVCCFFMLTFTVIPAAFASDDGSGSIAGQISGDRDMTGISGLAVRAYDSRTGSDAGSAFTSADGAYSISGLVPGSYIVEADAAGTGYQTKYFDNAGDYLSALPVRVNAGDSVTGIDFFLESADSGSTGQISGTFTAGDDGRPIADVSVCAYPAFCTSGCSDARVCTRTGADGTYILVDLPMGEYVVCSQPTDFFVGECFDHVHDAADATPIFVGSGVCAGSIDFSPARRSAVNKEGGTRHPVDSDSGDSSATDPVEVKPAPANQ